MNPVLDTRLEALRAWLVRALGEEPFDLEAASADASFRRYFRVRTASGTRIAMDAPPPQEDCEPFVRIAALFEAAGAHVPHVHVADTVQGFLLLEDLGNRTYLDPLREAQSKGDAAAAAALYQDATDALLRIQTASRPGVLPPYDEALLRRELQLFPDWYLARHVGIALDDDGKAMLAGVFDAVLRCNLAEPRVYVHRDFHSRNLMQCTPNPGVIDFQDAVHGPITYDLVSLFRDAYIRWDEAQVLDWVIRYWEKARRAGLPVHRDFAEFYRDFEWMGVQRHLKVLGIFARLSHRDGKDRYLADMPLVTACLRNACERYAALRPLIALLDIAEQRQPPAVLHTF
jgi:aminoglycoside/choline kinase family phosphotransferase